ncbi:hypothetical protein JOC77_003070 [Peribacillus deserti]|uniref:DUF3445 domain-containing protein n=1 Tax=Peribacillus deserti TaxID=673318 RepID=A0ABS2QMY3_9BACI|nr:DUF3445 domain-containing protein [Peribacillus deserti]MBM7693626.1 hypothetical protein [Peribacillus deserti]
MKLNELDLFPYPFHDDVYRYSNNSVLMDKPSSVEITPNYLEEINLKRKLLGSSPARCFQSLPYAKKAQWEVLEIVAQQLADSYPDKFSLDKKGKNWVFCNTLLNENHSFIIGDDSTLPHEPLDFIGRHVQEDLILMMQRDGDLYLDAGQLCFPANWSLAFNLGMKFKEIHNPIPGFKEEKLDDRILGFLLRVEAGNPWQRKNWSLMAGNRMDTSLETYDQWGKDRKKVTRENAGEFVYLRVEVQKILRMPRTNGILFTIHTYLLSLDEFCQNRKWLEQFYSILSELPEYIAEYKGLSMYKDQVLQYLKDKMKRGD